MTARLPALPLVGAALLVAVAASAAPDDPPPDPANDPLPAGGKARYGVTRPILRTSPGVALLPPEYTNFVAPTVGGGVRRYDLGTGRPLAKAANENDVVGAGMVVASGDGKRAAVSRPGSLAVVEVATNKQLLAVQPPEGVVLVGTPGASLSHDGTVLAYGGRGRDNKGEVVVWDVDRNEILARFETAQAAPVFPLLSRDGKTLVTHGPPLAPATLPSTSPAPKAAAPAPKVNPDALRTAQVWDVANVRELFRARVSGMGGAVVSSAFSADAGKVALSAGDGPVDVFEVKTGKRLHTLLGRKGQGVRVAISPDGKRVASVAPNYHIQMWDADGKQLGATDPPPGLIAPVPITGLAFVDNERAVGWQTAHQFAVAYEAPTGRLLSPLTDHISAINSIAVPDATDVYTAGRDGRVCRWDFPTGQLNEMIHLHPARIPGQPLVRPVVHLSADAKRATWPRHPAEVFDMETGNDLYCLPPPSAPPADTAVGVSEDGHWAMTVARSTDARRSSACAVWDVRAERRVAELELPESSVPPVTRVTPSGTRLVALTATRNPDTGKRAILVTGWDLKTGKKLGHAEDPTANGTVYLAVASETTAMLCSSSGRLWPVDFEAGRVLPDVDKLPGRGQEAVTGPVAFSPDGKRFAVGVVGEGLEDYGVRVYDWPGGKRTHAFAGHLGPVTALRFTPDGAAVASGAQDASVLLWDLKPPAK